MHMHNCYRSGFSTLSKLAIGTVRSVSFNSVVACGMDAPVE